MTNYNKATLASFFQTGDVPQGSDYANLIDSQVNLVETAEQAMAGNLYTTELITPRLSAANANITGILSANTVNVGSDFIIPGRLTASAATISTVLSAATINTGNFISTSITTGVVSASSINLTGGMSAASLNISGNVSANTIVANGTTRLKTTNVSGNFNLSGSAIVSGNIIGGNSIAASAALVGNSLNVTTDVSAGGNVYCSAIRLQSVTIISAAGTTQATGAVLTATINRLQGITDGQTTGFVLQANKRGLVQYLVNETNVSGNLWPPTGGIINNLAANAVFPIVAGAAYTVVHTQASAYLVK